MKLSPQEVDAVVISRTGKSLAEIVRLSNLEKDMSEKLNGLHGVLSGKDKEIAELKASLGVSESHKMALEQKVNQLQKALSEKPESSEDSSLREENESLKKQLELIKACAAESLQKEVLGAPESAA